MDWDQLGRVAKIPVEGLMKPISHISILSPMGRDPRATHGGITTVIRKLANEMADMGIRIDLLLFSNPPQKVVPAGLHPSIRLISLGTAPKIVTAFRLGGYLRRHSPDVLLCAGGRANTVGAWARILTRHSVPIWGSVHNTLSMGEKHMRFTRKLSRRILSSLLYRRLDGLIAVSQGVAADLSKYTGLSATRIKVIYNPVVDSKINGSELQRPPHPWFLSDQPPVILSAGRLAKQKDFPTLIRAFELVRKQTDCRLLILGEGKERKALEALIKELHLEKEVELPGFVPNPFPFMRHSAVFVISSRWEGLPTVLIEAMALGTPVVATDCPSGPKEILDNGKYGPLVPVGDPKALADAILHTLSSPPDGRKLEEGAMRFTVERSVQAYLETLIPSSSYKTSKPLSPCLSRGPIAFYGFHTGPGGIGHVMANLMNGMINAGVKVDLLLNGKNAEDMDQLDPQIRIVDIGRFKAIGAPLRLYHYLRETSPKVLLCNRERAISNAVLVKKAFKIHAKLAVRVGTHLSTNIRQRGLIKGTLRKASTVWSYSNADVIIAVSKGVAQDIQDVSGISANTIYALNNPTISQDLFAKAEEPIEHSWLTKQDIPVILGVGRLVKVKGFDTLIRAFALVLAKRPARLILLGEGRERSRLQALCDFLGIHEHVDMPGFVRNPFPFMKRASVFVLSSLREGSPNSLIEALALGVPVVSTDCPSGPREILADGKYGPLVPIGDPESMAEAIISVLSNPLPKSTLTDVAKLFGRDMCAKKYLDVLGLG